VKIQNIAYSDSIWGLRTKNLLVIFRTAVPHWKDLGMLYHVLKYRLEKCSPISRKTGLNIVEQIVKNGKKFDPPYLRYEGTLFSPGGRGWSPRKIR